MKTAAILFRSPREFPLSVGSTLKRKFQIFSQTFTPLSRTHDEIPEHEQEYVLRMEPRKESVVISIRWPCLVRRLAARELSGEPKNRPFPDEEEVRRRGSGSPDDLGSHSHVHGRHSSQLFFVVFDTCLVLDLLLLPNLPTGARRQH